MPVGEEWMVLVLQVVCLFHGRDADMAPSRDDPYKKVRHCDTVSASLWMYHVSYDTPAMCCDVLRCAAMCDDVRR
jgi:hypothetical protein